MITDQELLQEQAHLSMDQRCADLFKKKKLRISVQTLKDIYDIHQVTVKKVMTQAPETKPHLIGKRLVEMR
jgi:hypothetical protein